MAVYLCLHASSFAHAHHAGRICRARGFFASGYTSRRCKEVARCVRQSPCARSRDARLPLQEWWSRQGILLALVHAASQSRRVYVVLQRAGEQTGLRVSSTLHSFGHGLARFAQSVRAEPPPVATPCPADKATDTIPETPMSVPKTADLRLSSPEHASVTAKPVLSSQKLDFGAFSASPQVRPAWTSLSASIAAGIAFLLSRQPPHAVSYVHPVFRRET